MNIDKCYSKALAALTAGNKAIPTDSMKLTLHMGDVRVLCKPCSVRKAAKYIHAAAKEKALTNVKAHIQRKMHIDNAEKWQRNQRRARQHTSKDNTHPRLLKTKMSTNLLKLQW